MRFVQGRFNRGKENVACLSLAASHGHIYEAAGVCYSLLGPSLRGLLLCITVSVYRLRYPMNLILSCGSTCSETSQSARVRRKQIQ